jgi:LysM repeat protein
MKCYACEREATQRCPRCGNPYCPEHGDDRCAACLAPVAAVPSRNLYHFALFALFGGAVLALWLLIRPPGVPGEEAAVVNTEPTASPGLTPAGDNTGGTPTLAPTATLAPGGSVAPTAQASATATPEPTDEPEPTAAPTEAPTQDIQYAVQSGDSWNSIATAYGLDASALASYNGYTLDDVLPLGVTIAIPQ